MGGFGGGRLGHGFSQGPGVTASLGGESADQRAAVILTPDQRVRVFISSTLEELAEERAAARRAIRRLHLVPVWYESGARPHPPQSMYRAYLDQSQIFVGIYWQRYGWVGPGMEISGLEDEYRLAAGMPMLLYLKAPAPDREPGLTAMIDDIRSAGAVSYRHFTSTRELERLLADDLAILLSESFAGTTIGRDRSDQSAALPAVPGGVELPVGTVTFLLTDIEGSTRLWEADPGAMEAALQQHDRLLGEVIEDHGGRVVVSRGEGDSFFAVFPSAVSAVEAAGVCQVRLGDAVWPTGAALRVRMGLHTGEARLHGGDHLDHSPINRCARVRAAAHGGQVLLTKTTRDLVQGRLGGGFGLNRLGEFRLRDLAEPELIFQLTHADLTGDFPPIHTVAERIGNLPLQVSSFIGRARQLEQTAAALGEARLVTLTGPGGVGKTRLALQAAGQLSPRFGDGAWLCELAPIRDPAGVDDAVAAVFSVTARAGHTTREALVEFLRSKQLLLVLDNCEHLLDGAAALAAVLQRSCERLVILATSREGLGIDGERLLPVPPLQVPDADADLAAITQAEAVRLFAERAAAVKPDFAVTAANAAAVTAVVRRLDGIALAIELAAARVAAMTPAELARRLERSFTVLAAGRRGTLPHHQTLRATIDWSFQLLTQPQQRLLARLAVFAGGATLEAVETVCSGEGLDPDAVFELLAALVARSLVVAEEHGPETRYRLLETIRQYGEQHLGEAGETEQWRARHADYYANLLQQIRHDDRPDEVFWAVRLSARAGQPARGVVGGNRHRRRRHGFSDAGRPRAERGLVQLPPAARRRGGSGAARRNQAPGLLARPGGQRRVRLQSRGCERRRGAVPPRGRGQRAPRSPGLAGRGGHLRRPNKHRGYYRSVRRRRPLRRTGRCFRAGRRRPRRHLAPARHGRGLLLSRRRRAQRGPARERSAHAGPPDRQPGADRDRLARGRRGRRPDRPRTGPRLPARKPRAQHGARLSERPRPGLGDRDRGLPKRPDRHPRARPQCHPRAPTGQ